MERFGAKKQPVFSGTLHEVKEARPISTKANPTKEELSYSYPYRLKIQESRQVIKKLQQDELEITGKLRKLQLNRVKLKQKRKTTCSYSTTREKIELKVGEVERLEHYLCKLSVPHRPHQRKDSDICSLKEKFEEQIVRLHKGTHHGNINLVKERQLLKQIKQTRGELEKINAALPTEPTIQVHTHRQSVLDSKEAITEYIKVISKEVAELKLKRMRYNAYDARLDFEEAAMGKEIRTLEKKLKNIKQKRFKTIYALKRTINYVLRNHQ